MNSRIAVSRAGFSKTALEKAAQNNIKTLTLKEARETDWVPLTQKLTIPFTTFVGPTLTEVIVVVPTATAAKKGLLPTDLGNAELRTSEGSAGTVLENVWRAISMPKVLQEIRKCSASSGGVIRKKFRFVIEDRPCLVDKAGEAHAVKSIIVEAEWHVEKSEVNFTKQRYGDAEVLSGDVTAAGAPVKLVAVYREGKDTVIGVSFKPPAKRE